MKKYLLCLMMMVLAVSSKAAISITEVGGWFESGYVTWTGDNQNYSVYVRPAGGEYTQIDKELVRKYASYYRADMVGLKAGNYQFKIVGANNESVESEIFHATAHDRSGFAHIGYTGGIGAYKNDGTLKDNARVIYVTANTAKTVKCYVSDGKTDTEYTGLQAIIAAFEKGKETRPLAIRIIGTIKKADMDSFGSSAEGVQVKGKSGSTDMNITIEGIGNDATTHGFGFLIRNACSVELRNFANMICMDDCVSLDTDNHHIWIHNMDFFYGGTGSDSDQAKGDGSIDIKGKSSHVTISYNHFYDSGKCSLGGMKSENTSCWMTYHHNWFDHSDSRHPRIRTAFYHVYNNYFDGNSKYGVGVTMGGSAFVEANYFRNVKYPMLISKQGTDAEGSGTFSGENGGVNKAYNNIIINPRKVQYWSADVQASGAWDAVLVDNRDDEVTATALTGGTGYNAAADLAARTTYAENIMHDPEDIPEIVRGALGAGRLQHGDFQWTFNNSLQDENYDVIAQLKQALLSYESTVVSFADGTAISSRTPATATVDGGDGKGLDQDTNDSYVPSWAGGGSTIASGKQIIGVDGDYFYFTAENADQLSTYMTNGGESNPSTIMTNGTFSKTRTITNSSIGSCSDIVGSISLPSKGYLTLYNAGGISSAAFYVSASGSQSWQIATSVDGTTFTNVGSEITGKAGGHPTAAFTDAEGTVKYVRITNTNSSARDVQGIKLYSPLAASDLTALTTSTIEINESQTYTLTKGTDYSTTCTGAITFKSSATKIATIDENGKITPLAQGNTTITLTQANDETRNGGTLTFKVTVTDNRTVSDLTLTSDAEVTVAKGATSQITTTCSNAVTYVSSAPAIATVSESGLITAVAFGTATITINDPGSATRRPGTATVTVTVPDNRTASILAVANDELTVDRNTTVQIDVTAHTGAVTYRSVDESIATVDANGLVTGVLSGETTIVVSDAGSDAVKAGSVDVTITVNDTRAASQLAVTSDANVTIDMAVATTSAITTTGATGALTYESSDETIASVSAEGVITGKKAGTVEITITDAGNDTYKPGTATVTVTVVPVPSADPVTWIVNDASTLKAGTAISNGGTAIFISTDQTASELQYIGGSNCKIEVSKGIGTFKMGGATQYSSNELSTRYFILPALSGSGTLTVSYASSNQSDLTIKVSKGKNDATLATITKNEPSVTLTNLDNTVLYISAASKAYLNGITWTPSAPDTRAASTFALTSSNSVQLEANETSAITYEHAAGAVTFESSNTAVATVSAEGVITGVANGTATITVKDAGSSEVKGATLTITVTVTGGSTPSGATPATVWDFTQPLGSNDLTNLEADCEAVTSEAATETKNWYKIGITVGTDEVTRYGIGKTLAAKVKNSLSEFVQLKANGNLLDVCKGLLFARYNNALGAKGIRIDNGKRLNTNTSELAIKIPSLKAGDVVKIHYASSNNAESRTFTITNGTSTETDNTKITTTSDGTAKEGTITVTADGDLILQASGGMNIYSISVNAELPTAINGIETVRPADRGAMYDLSGRRITEPRRGQLYIQNGKKYIYR